MEKDKEQLLLTRGRILKDGRRCVASGMAAPRSTVEVDVESLSKVLVQTSGSPSAESRYPWESGCLCPYGHPGPCFERKSQCEKSQSVYRRDSQKSLNVVFVLKKSGREVFHVGKVENVSLLRRRASPRLDVEYIRHLDTRVPQLVFSVIFPEHVFWVCSQTPLTLVSPSRLWIMCKIKSATQNLDMVCFCRQVK